ncbi:MAG: GNAT family N-acetyltransferase, partial [Oricola sp.]|nr:GNAT family N-acetyltransferase [Oricola sp.]
MRNHRNHPAGAYVIRLAGPEDLDGFMALAQLAGPGFTSLPADRRKLASILEASAAASAGAPGAVMLAMEDLASKKIAGCAAVKRGGEKRPGFANFRTGGDASGAVRTLTVTDEYADLTEIGGLFVRPDHRSKGVGKALAQSRYLYLATAPETFGARVFAELRGVIDDDGVSPFFDAASKPFLGMNFIEADRLCAAGENARLAALLPKTPISTEAFPPEAKAAIGACHKTGAAARAMLEKEGFRFEGVVDLLDGGALVA